MGKTIRSMSSCLVPAIAVALLLAGGCKNGAESPGGGNKPSRVVGTDWEKTILDEDVFGAQGEDVVITDVCEGGPGLAAVGFRAPRQETASSGKEEPKDPSAMLIWTSEDGRSWNRTEVAIDTGLSRTIGPHIAAGPGGMVIAWGLSFWTSGDGLDWTYHPPDNVNFKIELTYENAMHPDHIRDICAAGPGYVMMGKGAYGRKYALVGHDVCEWVSSDGQAFSLLPFDSETFGGFAEINSVCAGGPGAVAVGIKSQKLRTEGQVWTSPDGISWYRLPSNESVFGGPGEHIISDICTGGPGLVAVGYSKSTFDQKIEEEAIVWTSSDGVDWTRSPSIPALRSSYIFKVSSGGPGLVAIGSSPPDQINFPSGKIIHHKAAVWVSPDGAAWNRVMLPDCGDLDNRIDLFSLSGKDEFSYFSITTFRGGLLAIGNEKTGSEGPTRPAIWTSMP